MKKKIILVLAIFSFSFFSNAQTSIDTKSENFKISKVYVGVLSAPTFSLENGNISPFASVRIGGEVSYQLSSKLSVNSFIANEFTKDYNIAISSYYLMYKFTKGINLQVGQVATPATLFRPHPVSMDGQFESQSTAQLPGGGLGATLSFKKYKIGVYKKGDYMEFHTYAKAKNFSIGTWYSDKKEVGVVSKFEKGKVSTTLSYIANSEVQKINNLFVYTLNKSGDLFLYTDVIYEIENQNLTRFQIGVLQYFKTKIVKGLIGGSYDYTTNAFNGYLQLNL